MTKVLVVDDEIPEQRHLSDILYSSFSGSVTVQCADNGKEAVSQASLWNPDIILMDIEMPVMDGFEATMNIRKLPNRIRANIPIIALTANAVPENRESATVAGMDDFLVKPTNSARLLRSLAKFL